MNTAAIARHLNIAESAITRCEEWAKVLFVVAQGLGARFVSKKVMSIDRAEAAKKIKETIECIERETYTCNVWSKSGHCRIYIKDTGYTNTRAQDKGFISIQASGAINYDNLGRGTWIKDEVKALCLDIEPEDEVKAKSGGRDIPTIQDSWKAYHQSNPPKDYYYGAADEESW